MNEGWYFAERGKPVGPMSLDDLVARLPGLGGGEVMVYGPGAASWTPARQVPDVAARMRGGGGAAPPPPPPAARGGHAAAAADVIDYQIFGQEMQYAEVTLDPGETVIAEPGGMMYMTAGIKMETVFGDPSKQNQGGIFGKLATAGKRMLTGESLFMTTFTAAGGRREAVAFAAPYPGKIVPLHLDQLGREMICQKDSFLCAARGVQIGIAFQKKIGVGLFGGEGFIMQRLTGDGIALVHAGGTLLERELAAGETLKIDTGCIVALQPSVGYDIQFVGGFKNTLFGGEGLFFATLTGPGRIWLQSLPFSRLAGRVLANAGPAGGKGEGSILGGVGLGSLLGGDE
jgi:uncharacterized protein (TIGR00266 family)